MKKFITTSALAEVLKVSSSTIRTWSNEGKIPFNKTKGGHRRFDLDEVKTTLSKNIKTMALLYLNCRDKKQNEMYKDIARLIFERQKGWNIKYIIYDVSSPINTRSEEFENVISLVVRDKINRIILPFRTIMGFYGKQMLLETICTHKNIDIVTIEESVRDFSKDDFLDLLNILNINAKYIENKGITLKIDEIKKELVGNEDN